MNPKLELTAADGTTELPLATVPVLLATDDNYQRLPSRCNRCVPVAVDYPPATPHVVITEIRHEDACPARLSAGRDA